MPMRSTLPIELYRAAQVRELDRIAIEDRGIPSYTLMSAGRKHVGSQWSAAAATTAATVML